MNKATVVLGGRSYEVRELPSRANARWRRAFTGSVDGLVGSLVGGAALLDLELDGIEPETAEAAIGNIRAVAGAILDAVDDVPALICSYSPDLLADLEWIQENAFDSELGAALVAVLGLAFPFGALAAAVRSLGAGDRKGGTAQSSP